MMQRMGWMTLSREESTTCFSKLKTAVGYERQGIGSLVVALGVMFAVVKGDQYVKLGEPDTQGGTFWTGIGLSEARNLTTTVLKRMLDTQQVLAGKLAVAIDPMAFLVEMHPTCTATGGGRMRSNSAGQ
ncbi:hypothetical protein PY254_00005 [Rhodanobacter sp. AS-Z3]|uniref:hypothetical protein n=1 Tax=Rhodanobacter sp. AS-Z3 TaxID=3031330 RepID=UPI00247A19EA|nr:hypothetical protein [Rhodanobacter sp. AS-Z3]WEN15104.1 hypothetical protein PY254_00005 [Rhodanobacter sp. AS-Z3]